MSDRSSPGVARLGRDAAFVAAGQAAAVLSALVFTIVAARVLTPADFGALSWALSWLTYLSVLAQVGLTQVATISFARGGPGGHGPLLARLLAAEVLAVAVVVVVWWSALGPAAAGAGDPPGAYDRLVAVVALWLPAAAIGPIVVNAFRARGRFGASVVFGEHVRRVVLIGALAVAAAAGTTTAALTTVAWWSVALETLVYVGGVALLAVAVGAGPAARDRSRSGGGGAAGGVPSVAGLLRLGSAFTVATLASVTVPQAGIWFLAAFASVQEVAVFSVAVRIAVLLATPTAIGMRTLAPRIAAAHERGRLTSLEEVIRRSAVWTTTATVAATVVLAVAGPFVVPALFGGDYGDAVVPTLIMAAGVIVNAWTGPCSVVLSHAGEQRVVAISALVSSLLFFGASAVLAPAFGAEGVALTAAVAMGVRNLHLARAAERLLGIRTMATPRRRRP